MPRKPLFTRRKGKKQSQSSTQTNRSGTSASNTQTRQFSQSTTQASIRSTQMPNTIPGKLYFN